MPAKITFTQAEQAALEKAIDNLRSELADPLESLLNKMVKAREKESTAFHGVGVAKVLEMARNKFGDRFKTPNIITAQWTIKMQKAINDAGVTEATAKTAIDKCNWEGDIFAAKLIYQLAELAVVTPRQQKLFTRGPAAPTKKVGWLGRLNEDE